MDKKEAIKIAQKYISNLSKKYVIEKAYLYGSFAKGTNHADSDIDLALVFPAITDIIDIQIDLMQMRGNEDLILEPHPFRKKDFNLNHPVVAEILKTGIEITNTSTP
jgi:predicted nucleotidyltransferase